MSQDLKINSLFNVQGKVAVVTGGGSGIGQMIATGLVANGVKVYIVSRKEKQLKETSERLSKMGPGSCRYIVGDLTSKAGCDSVIGKFKEQESKLHILVNNSGSSWAAPWNNFPEKEGWDRVLSLNVKSLFYMTQGLSDLLAKDATNLEPGRVVNISSVVAIKTATEDSEFSAKGNGMWSYHTSKAAVNQLTSNMAVTLIRQNVTCNAIMPGTFPTRMTAFSFKTYGEEAMNATQPTGRVGKPSDIAGLTLFLCSPASAHVTGAHIPIDGGQTISKM